MFPRRPDFENVATSLSREFVGDQADGETFPGSTSSVETFLPIWPTWKHFRLAQNQADGETFSWNFAFFRENVSPSDVVPKMFPRRPGRCRMFPRRPDRENVAPSRPWRRRGNISEMLPRRCDAANRADGETFRAPAHDGETFLPARRGNINPHFFEKAIMFARRGRSDVETFGNVSTSPRREMFPRRSRQEMFPRRAVRLPWKHFLRGRRGNIIVFWCKSIENTNTAI